MSEVKMSRGKNVRGNNDIRGKNISYGFIYLCHCYMDYLKMSEVKCQR